MQDTPQQLTSQIEDLRLELKRERAEMRQLELSLARERQKATGFGYAYRGIRANVEGVRPSVLGHAPGSPPTPEVRAEHEAKVKRVVGLASLGRVLADGGDLNAAATAMVRDNTHTAGSVNARRVAQSLYDNPATREAGTLATGLVAHVMGLPKFAWERFSELPDEVWLTHVPNEYLLLAGQFDPERCAAALDYALTHPHPLQPRQWLDLCRRAMGLGMPQSVALAERYADAVENAIAAGGLSDEDRDKLIVDRDWVQRWAPRVAQGTPEPVQAPEGAVAFGIMGYDQPDRRNTSTNIGDHVQTIASMTHLVRHTGARFDDSDLGRFAADLAARVPRDLRIEGPERQVALYAVDRDASSYSAVPDGTWMLAFGWYAHKLAGVRHDFPFTDRVKPIYVSFHINKRAMLTPEAIEHLRAHAPIGCRDWSTVDLLLGLDIPAFFSGCLTTTVRFAKPDDAPEPAADAPVIYVDTPSPTGEQVRNERSEVALAPLATNLREALAALDVYISGASKVVTKRLHSYLPARAMGREVDFVPGNPADIRFNGLNPLTDQEVHDMGARIGDILSAPMTAILAGAGDEEVRAAWTDATRDLVAQAQERRATEVTLPHTFDVDAAVASIREGIVDVPASAPGPEGEPINVVLALDGNLKAQFRVVVQSILDHASRPVHLHVLSRDHDSSDHELIRRLFPTLHVTWLPCDVVDYGEIRAMIPHITVSTMDRLLLPELLSDLDRVVYHDIDALPLADLAELYDIDLEGHPLAARDSEANSMISGYESIFGPAQDKTLPPELGHEAIRLLTARHPFDWVGFNAGVLVLDLDRMRRDDFCRTHIPFAGNFGMHDQHILNVYVGADRLPLGPEWNARPTQESVSEPKIVHWAGGQKPWDPGYVSYQPAWREIEQRVRAHEASVLGTDPSIQA
ncbi:glycosyltransferase [Janibacter sp. G56]|uniref:glycosyltransferase n=1 Tax=Janibacter sp. G56 TaxID=3418717 RepID=UPI003CFF7D32